MSEAICTWPSCGHTAKGQCGLRLVFDPVTRSAVRINPPPDLPPTLSADLIRLRAEVSTLRASEARLREALRPLATMAERYDPDEGDGHLECWSGLAVPKIQHLRTARAAIKEDQA